MKGVSGAEDPERLSRALSDGLQRLRGQLAIAIAAERKSTPITVWKRYYDADNRMRQLVRQLRTGVRDFSGVPSGFGPALKLLESHAAADGKSGQRTDSAGALYRTAAEVLASLEQS